jgi:hypothetical protein
MSEIVDTYMKDNIIKYFTTCEISLLLYSIFQTYINATNAEDKDVNIICFQFDNFYELIKWLRGIHSDVGVRLTFINEKVIDESEIIDNVKDELLKSNSTDKLRIIITCLLNEAEEIYCSLSVINKIYHKESFNILNEKYKTQIATINYIP